VVILSSVSSAERLPSSENTQGNALRADDIADDIFTTDDTTDDIAENTSTVEDRTKNIVSKPRNPLVFWRSIPDDTDDKNPQSTCSDRPRRFKIGDVVRYSGQSDNLQRSIYE
jgi:hypothetical protein